MGEDENAQECRNIERTERRGSRALIKANLNSPTQLSSTDVVGPRSSLKTKSITPRTSALPRSSSLESPKKLRFATDGNLLEHHRYHR